MLGNKKFVSSAERQRRENSIWGKYLARMRKNSLLYFGVPFFSMMLIGTHFMTQFAALRYERHDQREKELSQEDSLSLSARKRKVDMREEYYRLQHMDLDNWEQKRVQRLPGESDNKW